MTTPTASPSVVTPADFRHAALLNHARGDWAFSVARRYLYETADAVRLAALARSAHEPLAALTGKMRREETYHLLHAEAWLRRLAEAHRRPPSGSPRRCETLWPDAQEVFAPLAEEEELVRSGLLPSRCAPCTRRGVKGPAGRSSRSPVSCRTRRRASTAVRARTDEFAWLHRRVHDGVRARRRRPHGDRDSDTQARERRSGTSWRRFRIPRSRPSAWSTSASSAPSPWTASRGARASCCPRSSAARPSTSCAQITERLGALEPGGRGGGRDQLRPAVDERSDLAAGARAAAAQRLRAAGADAGRTGSRPASTSWRSCRSPSARTAARATRPSTIRSGRPCVARSTTAPTAASRSSR